MHHPNSNIQSLTQSIFEIKDGLDSATKSILDEMKITAEKSLSYSKHDSVVKKKEETEKEKDGCITSSFLNRKSVNTRSTSNKPSEKDERKTLILPESDSQVNNFYYILSCYIFIRFFIQQSLYAHICF